MKSQLWWKWLIVAGLVVCSVLLVTPPKDKVRLGLDLQGGYSFTVALDEETLKDSIREDLKTDIRKKNPKATEDELTAMIDEALVEAKFQETVLASNETTIEIIRNRIDSLGTEEPVITKDSKGRIAVQMPGASDAQRDRAEKMIRSAAFLEFRLVKKDSDAKAADLLSQEKAPKGYMVQDMPGYGRCYVRLANQPEATARDLRNFGNPGVNYVCMLEKDYVGANRVEVYKPIFVKRRAEQELTGKYLTKAGVQTDEFGKVMVSLAFDGEGAKKFADITRKHCKNSSQGGAAGDRMAIVLDGVVYSSPVLNEPITGGHAVISGNFSMADAAMLKNVLNAGAMPAPLKVLSKRFVNPTLGEDSIASAKTAILVGCGAVILFMLVYYRTMGLVADLALVMNFILLPFCAVVASGLLSQVSPDATFSGGSLLKLPVLTLPGIAGLLLSVGMAVDANVLIYERSREEFEAKRPTYPSLMAGYQRAFSAIFDGNLTTIITGAILFIVGTGMVRGFAVTLVAGIIGSMFTALVVTKIVYQSCVSESSTWKPTMMRMVRPDININFLGRFKRFTFAAVAIVVVTCAITAFRGIKDPASIFDVDFTGGARVSYTVDENGGMDPAALVGAVREAANNAGISDAVPQLQSSEDGQTQFLEVKTVYTEINGKEISGVLNEALAGIANAKFTYLDVDSIGSQVGSEMKKSAALAILFSTIAMLVYIGFRFEFGFGLGAIVALVHDVLITIGIFSCLGFQFNLTIVAALLTIVGYGVNDTIVLFDRVREDLKKDQKSSFRDLVNRAVNRTLSRTVLTSLTTLLPVASLIVFCQGEIRGFAVCMLIGLIVSTFSSIFIASPVMLGWYHNRRPDMRKAD